MLFPLLIPFSIFATKMIHTTYVAMNSKIKGFCISYGCNVAAGIA